MYVSTPSHSRYSRYFTFLYDIEDMRKLFLYLSLSGFRSVRRGRVMGVDGGSGRLEMPYISHPVSVHLPVSSYLPLLGALKLHLVPADILI